MLALDIEVPRREFSVAVAFSVAAGERFALFGPSGAGKSTVVEAIAGLVQPAKGSITLAGRVLWSVDGARRPRRPVPVWERAVALLRQEPALFPHLNVRENLCYARRSPHPATVARLVGMLNLEGVLDARPSTLSGGQAHRVALARALATDYEAVLLDEPYTGLDAALRRQVTTLVRDEVASRGVPAVLVSHELEEAQAFADRLGVIDHGRLLQVDSPRQVVLRPATRRAAELVGYSGFVPRGGAVVGVHPQRVRLGAYPHAGPVLTARVGEARPAGAGLEADLQVGHTQLTCKLDGEVDPPGTTVEITVVDPPFFASDGSLLPDSKMARP